MINILVLKVTVPKVELNHFTILKAQVGPKVQKNICFLHQALSVSSSVIWGRGDGGLW